MSGALPDERRMWIRSFYGFDPEEEGHVGWTKEAGRDNILRQIRDGDLFLIYGAGTNDTEKALRSFVQGFVQVDAKPIMDTEKSSAAATKRKAERGWTDRWIYGIPIRRAWRATEKVPITSVAFKTYRADAGQAIGVWGAELEPDEIEKALQVRVREVNVFGEPPVKEDEVETTPFRTVFKPSRAFPGSSGRRDAVYEDGETALYLAEFLGDGHALLNRRKQMADKRTLLKIGVTKTPREREKQLNSGIPPAAPGKWKIGLTASFPDRSSAEKAEQQFKDCSASKLESVGGEFFWGEKTDAEILFAKIPGVSRF
jgi:hypothetical protein